MDDLIGFSEPNDYSTFLLRAKLAKRYGHFGRIPMWGGVKLHEFYAPLATGVVRALGMTGALALYLLLTFAVWSWGRNPLVAVLYVASYYHIFMLVYAGRFAEFFGYTLATLAFFIGERFASQALIGQLVAGALLGLAALSHPVPLIFGSVCMALFLDPIPYVVAFAAAGWWYIPFFRRRGRLAWVKGATLDKRFFGVYINSYLSMINAFLFLLLPPWISFIGVILWVLPISLGREYKLRLSTAQVPRRLRFLTSKLARPLFLSRLSEEVPNLNKVQERSIILKRGRSSSGWIWGIACYLLDRGVVVYNGLPFTEVPVENLKAPKDVPAYSIEELMDPSIEPKATKAASVTEMT